MVVMQIEVLPVGCPGFGLDRSNMNRLEGGVGGGYSVEEASRRVHAHRCM